MKKLLIILGAGSSIGLGLPGVDAISSLMKQWAAEWPLSALGHEDYYAAAEEGMRRYVDGSTVTNQHRSINFETILGDMAALANWVTPSPYGTTLRGLVGRSDLGLQFPNGRYGGAVAVNDQLTCLLTKLADHIRAQSRAIDGASPGAKAFAALFGSLRRSFDIGVFNLNYDTAALTAWPDAFTGFDNAGRFVPEQVHERQELGFVYHLHGSVHHSQSDIFGRPIVWRRDLSGEFDDGNPNRSTEKLSDQKSMPRTTLVAGGFKLDQLLVEPFHSLAASLVRHAHSADAVLIGGYGFGDAHVNRALLNRLEGRENHERPPIMILDFALPKTDSLHFRHDDWAMDMSHTLMVSGHLFAEAGYGPSAAHPFDLAARSGFELDKEQKTALWHGGFEKAADRSDDIAAWLGGGADQLLKADTPPT